MGIDMESLDMDHKHYENRTTRANPLKTISVYYVSKEDERNHQKLFKWATKYIGPGTIKYMYSNDTLYFKGNVEYFRKNKVLRMKVLDIAKKYDDKRTQYHDRVAAHQNEKKDFQQFKLKLNSLFVQTREKKQR